MDSATLVDALRSNLNGHDAETPGGSREARLVIRALADVTPKPVDWLWHRWLARGKLHLLGGHAGDGKSALMTAIAAIGSTGGMWPDGSPAPTFRTLFVLGEDAIDDTLRPRLDLFGADVSRVHAIATVLDGDNQYRVFNIAKHLPLLEAAIIENAFDVLVIDPLTFIMPGADRNAEGDTRDALTPLVKLADRTNVAVMGIAHVGKPSGSQRTPAQRILGATAFHSMARVVWMTTNTGGGLMAVGPVKANLSTKPNAVMWQWEEDQPITWQGASDCLLEALLDSPVSRTPREDAEGWLRERLAGGAEKSAVIETEGKDRGFSWATLRRAADIIGVKKYKAVGVGAPWYWMLPDGVPVLSTESKVIQVDFGAGSASPDAESPNDETRNVLTPLDAEVSKLSTLPESNLLISPCAEQVPAMAPFSASGADETPRDVTKLAQLAHPPVLRSEQVTPPANCAQPERCVESGSCAYVRLVGDGAGERVTSNGRNDACWLVTVLER